MFTGLHGFEDVSKSKFFKVRKTNMTREHKLIIKSSVSQTLKNVPFSKE